MEISTCAVAVDPLLLPVRDNPVSVQGVGSVRGIPITLSSPSQFFSFLPTVNDNNTFVYTYCDTSNYTCIAEHGGVYSPPANVQRTNSYGSWNGTIGRDVQDGGAYVFFNDLMTVESHDIYGFPFYSYQQKANADAIQPGLGLGQGSAFLRAAADLELVPSKQWAYYGGDELSGIDGHLIVGGYDKNRVDGDFTSFPTDPNRILYLSISDMAWVTSSGNRTSLLQGTGYQSLDASVNPFFPYIYVPNAVRDNFEEVTGSYTDPTTGYAAYSTPPSGSFEITLSNNQVITIPSSLLFDHGLSYDSQGEANTTTYPFWLPKVVRQSDYPDYTLNFGAPFLAQQYLVTDFDAGNFYLANAVLGTGSAVSITPLCTGGPQPTGSSVNNPNPRKKTNVGAIAGGVVGGVVGLILIGALIFFLLRRKRSASEKPNPEPQPPAPQNNYMQQPQAPYSPQPPHYASGIPAGGAVYAEKDGVGTLTPNGGQVFAEKDGASTTAQTLSPTSHRGSTGAQGIGELPSPTTTFSRTSQGFSEQQERPPQALVEMPAERYD